MDDLGAGVTAQRLRTLTTESRQMIARSLLRMQDTQRALEASGRLLVGSTSEPPDIRRSVLP